MKNLYNILLFAVLVGYAACNGQGTTVKTNQTSVEDKTVLQIGETISEIGKGILIIFQDSKGNYWFGSKGEGVYKYDGQKITHFTKEYGLCSNAVRGIQEDKHGNIFFDTGEGICKFNGATFETLKVIRNSLMVKNEWKLTEDDLWFEGNWNENGPYRYDGKSLYHLEFEGHPLYEDFKAKNPNSPLEPMEVYSIYKDKEGNIWFGTLVFGVCRYDGKSLSWIIDDELGELPDGRVPAVRSIIEDKDGHFWFSNILSRYHIYDNDSTGLDKIRYDKLQGIDIEKEKDKVQFPYFMSIVDDNDGNLWMATYSQGVWKYDGEELTHFPIQIEGKEGKLFSIYRDNQGDLWLGTHNLGVLKYNGETFEVFEID